MSASAAPALEPRGETIASWKLLLTLGLGGAASGLLIVLLYTWTLPGIEAHKAGILRAAIANVLKAPARSDTLYLVNGSLTDQRPPGDEGAHVERIFRGYNAAGAPVGYAIANRGPGFSETIELIFGVDFARHELLGMTILESKETPGIADGIERPAFLGQFVGAKAPVIGVKASKKEPGAVVMITGATISSRAIIKTINTAVIRWQPIVERYEQSRGK